MTFETGYCGRPTWRRPQPGRLDSDRHALRQGGIRGMPKLSCPAEPQAGRPRALLTAGRAGPSPTRPAQAIPGPSGLLDPTLVRRTQQPFRRSPRRRSPSFDGVARHMDSRGGYGASIPDGRQHRRPPPETQVKTWAQFNMMNSHVFSPLDVTSTPQKTIIPDDGSA